MVTKSLGVAGEHAHPIAVLKQLADQPPTDVTRGACYQAERGLALGVAKQRESGGDLVWHALSLNLVDSVGYCLVNDHYLNAVVVGECGFFRSFVLREK
jgi:hypothetical protein